MARAQARPVAALAICGAVLLVPLALAVPGVAPEAGEEVVLAAGSFQPTGPGGTDEPVAEAASEVQDEEVEEAAVAEQSTGSGPSATRRGGQKPASKGRSATASTATGKRTAARSSGGSKPPPASSTESKVAKIAVAGAVAAQAAPPSPPPPPDPPDPPDPPARPAHAARAPSRAPADSAVDGVWNRLAVCESGNTNDPGAPYYGYWQFSAGTWSSLGEPGLPNDHSRERQLAVAKRLKDRSGWGQWPRCARQLGLL